MNPIRWLLLAGQVPPSGSHGGIVRYLVEVARELNAHPEVELHVLSAPATVDLWQGLGIPVHRIHTSKSAGKSFYPLVEASGIGLPRIHGGWDVVHGAKHLVPAFVPPRTRLRVLTVHDMLPLERPGDFRKAKRWLLPRQYLRSIGRADLLLSVSAATRARLVSYVRDTSDRVDVVPLAMSNALRVAVPQQVDRLVGKNFALVVGDPSPRKNLATLVEAWPRVRARVPAAILAVAGPPAWHKSHSLEAAALLDEGSVVSLGHVSDEELAWCYRHASVVLCPSRLEGFGLPAVEALAFGADLITSQDAALTEVSGDGAAHLPADDVAAWSEAIAAAMGAGSVSSRHSADGLSASRNWRDVAYESVAAVQRRLEQNANARKRLG